MFTEKKHLNELTPNLKFLPCYYDKNFKYRKLYFGSVFSGPQPDLIYNKILYANGFSYYSVKNSIGLAHLSNSFSILSPKDSYNLSEIFFNFLKSSNSNIWTFVKSNFYAYNACVLNTEQLRNFSVKSYRRELINHLCFPQTRQDKVLNARLNWSSTLYSISISANSFCNVKNNNLFFNNLFLIPSLSFCKINSFFSNKGHKLNFSFVASEGVFLNSIFSNLSNRTNSSSANYILNSHFGLSRLNFLKFSNNSSYRKFFNSNRDFLKYFMNIKKNLPLNSPSAGVRFNLLNFISRNALLRQDSRTATVLNQKWVKDHYEILYNDYLTLSPQATKMICSSTHFSNVINKTISKIANSDSRVFFRHLLNKKTPYSVLAPYFYNLSKIYNYEFLDNYFIRDLTQKQNKSVPYRRAGLAKYYKALCYLPDNKSMKSRRRR